MLLASLVVGPVSAGVVRSPSGQQGTAIQMQIESERQRLKSDDIEQRRDALTRLGNMRRADASRVAASGLTDLAPVVRVTAMRAVLHLPPDEAAGLLAPMLQDKLEFIRREAAYALGETRSRSAVAPLEVVLRADKEVGVRAAAAVSLGKIADESAVVTLAEVLSGQSQKKKKAKAKENEFVLRAAARSLGQIKSRAGVEVLIATLGNDTNENDVRREAATALGLIGDASAAPALKAALDSATDPYLADAARDALRRLANHR
jgi:HEAT repeat protein